MDGGGQLGNIGYGQRLRWQRGNCLDSGIRHGITLGILA